MKKCNQKLKPRPKSEPKGRVSLERALSKLGFSSRTEARALIEGGRVKVHGSLETNPDRPVNPDTAHIEVDGEKAIKQVSRLFLFHKPKGVVTTKHDPEGRKTIYDFLPEALKNFHSVGRLDMHTTGLLLLTNDTRLSSFLTDPHSRIPRVYIVQVRGEVQEATLHKMLSGVIDQGELLKADQARILKSSSKESKLELRLLEGKNREIRRLCQNLEHEVTALKRISFGDYQLGDLGPGQLEEVMSTAIVE